MFIPQLISSCISVVFQQHQSNWHLLIIFWLFRPCFSPICSALSYFLIFLFKNVKFPRYVRPVLLTFMPLVASKFLPLTLGVSNPVIYTTLKIAQVFTALLVEQCCNNTVIIAKQCCSTNNVVHHCLKNVAYIDEATTVVHGCWNRRKQYW